MSKSVKMERYIYLKRCEEAMTYRLTIEKAENGNLISLELSCHGVEIAYEDCSFLHRIDLLSSFRRTLRMNRGSIPFSIYHWVQNHPQIS